MCTSIRSNYLSIRKVTTYKILGDLAVASTWFVIILRILNKYIIILLLPYYMLMLSTYTEQTQFVQFDPYKVII